MTCHTQEAIRLSEKELTTATRCAKQIPCRGRLVQGAKHEEEYPNKNECRAGSVELAASSVRNQVSEEGNEPHQDQDRGDGNYEHSNRLSVGEAS